jgi:hypothetical protein
VGKKLPLFLSEQLNVLSTKTILKNKNNYRILLVHPSHYIQLFTVAMKIIHITEENNVKYCVPTIIQSFEGQEK